MIWLKLAAVILLAVVAGLVFIGGDLEDDTNDL